jgi:hypothetical protein
MTVAATADPAHMVLSPQLQCHHDGQITSTPAWAHALVLRKVPKEGAVLVAHLNSNRQMKAAFQPRRCATSFMSHDAVMSAHLQIKAGTWFDDSGRRKIITQYHEVVGFFLGRKVQVSWFETLCYVGCARCYSFDRAAILERSPAAQHSHEAALQGIAWMIAVCYPALTCRQ